MKAPQKRPRQPSTHDWLTNGIANMCEDLNAAQIYLDQGLPGLAKMEAESAVERMRQKCKNNKAAKWQIQLKIELGKISVECEFSDNLGDIEITLKCRRFS